jgi:hypothetical protein
MFAGAITCTAGNQPLQELDLDVGLEYPGTPAQAAGNVSMLWRADLADRGVLEWG